MNILVAGGAGFIGSNLTRRLIAGGHQVTVFDNLATGLEQNLPDDAAFYRCDVSDGEQLNLDRTFDLIYNLACPASPRAYARDPLGTLDACYLGTRNLLRLVGEQTRFVQASTSEVYGDPLRHPQDEDYWGNVNPIGPRSCYDEGKRVAETLCYEYNRVCGSVTVARIFNTYGPFMSPNDGRVVSNFICQLLDGQRPVVYGDGGQTRSFCYVDDTVEALVRLGTGAGDPIFGPFNIGNPNEITVGQLASKILRLFRGMISGVAANDSDETFAHAALPQDDPMRRRPDISRIQNTYGWSPRVDLDEGLRRTISHFMRSR